MHPPSIPEKFVLFGDPV